MSINGNGARPFIHVVCCGGWGSGKSTFFSTFPKPMLVMQTDPSGKDAPYLRRGLLGEEMIGEHDQIVRSVFSHKDESRLIVQIEIFGDEIIKRPTSYPKFSDRFDEVVEEVRAGMWATVIVDGVTELEFSSRKYAEYVTKKGYKDQKAFYASSGHDVEEVIKQTGRLRCHTGIAAHLDERFDEVKGHRVHMPAAPGKNASRFGSNYTEIYVAHCLMGKRTDEPDQYWLQTRTDHSCAAASGLLQAPNPCEPTFQALWANFSLPVVKSGASAPQPAAAAAAPEEASNGEIR